jgi:hypothetical protein
MARLRLFIGKNKNKKQHTLTVLCNDFTTLALRDPPASRERLDPRDTRATSRCGPTRPVGLASATRPQRDRNHLVLQPCARTPSLVPQPCAWTPSALHDPPASGTCKRRTKKAAVEGRYLAATGGR